MLVSNNGLPLSMPVELISTKWGWMAGPKGDTFVTGSLKRWGVYSETEILILRQLCSDKRVLVIGGNIGALAVPVGQVATYVEVYEPQPIIYQLLLANARMCNTRAYPVHGAVGPAEGTIQVPIVDFGKDCNMGMIGKEHWGKGVDVQMYDINKVLRPSTRFGLYDFLVVDAEGMELEILSAAKPELLPEQMWVECDREDSGKELIAKIIELGYDPYWMVNPLTPNGHDPSDSPWPMQSSFNLLCLRPGAEWPLGDIPQFPATIEDNIGNAPIDKMIWSVE